MSLPPALDPSIQATALRMARLLYPHDALPDRVYAEVLNRALAAFSGKPALHEMLSKMQKALDEQQRKPWIDLDEEGQITALRAIDRADFFATIRGAIQTTLYNHPSTWAALGYEGPSFEKGGYIGRGAGIVDWLQRGS